MKRILFFVTLLTMVLFSCEKKVDWSLQTGESTVIVVDGIITNEMKFQKIHLSYPVSNPNEKPPGVSGAEVIITLGDSIYHFHEVPGEQGSYESDIAFQGQVDKEHSLLISSGNNVFSAKATMDPTNSNLPVLTYSFNASKGMYTLTYAADPYTPVFPAMYEILFDWSEVAGYENAPFSETKARLLYYTLPTLDVSELLPPTTENVYFPAGSKVIQRKYSLTREHAEFIRALLSETNWQGGFFSSAVANVPTNLSAGAIGYFGACVVVSRTAVVGTLKKN